MPATKAPAGVAQADAILALAAQAIWDSGRSHSRTGREKYRVEHPPWTLLRARTAGTASDPTAPHLELAREVRKY